MLIAYISMLPGGIGAREVALTTLLISAGIDPKIAAASAVLMRVVGMSVIFVLGGVSQMFQNYNPTIY